MHKQRANVASAQPAYPGPAQSGRERLRSGRLDWLLSDPPMRSPRSPFPSSSRNDSDFVGILLSPSLKLKPIELFLVSFFCLSNSIAISTLVEKEELTLW